MNNRAAGIDLSDRSVELVSFRSRGRGVIDGIVRAELPPSIVSRGEIQDIPELLKHVQPLFSSLFPNSSGKVQLGMALPETQVFSKIFRMPNGLEKKQYLQALEIAASEEFPFDSVSDMSYGSVCIEETENGKFYLFSVTSLQLAEGYEQFMRELGAEPSFLEPESVALARATVPEQKDAVDILLADIGARTTMLVVLGRHSQPIFSAAVPVGGDVLSTAIEEQLKISLADAEQLKRKSGFDLTVDDGRVMMIIQQPFNEIAKEIKSTIDYYKKRTGRNVRKIMLAGGTSLLPVIIDYVSSRFPGIEVVTADPLAGINISSSAPLPDNLKEEAVLYSTAIGLAQRAAGSRDRPGPDLLPRKTRSSRKKRSPLRYIRSIFKKVPSSYASK